jgi:hypothetical protein
MTLNTRIISRVRLQSIALLLSWELLYTSHILLLRVLTERYKKRYKSVKRSSVSDLSASAEQEISKDGTVLAIHEESRRKGTVSASVASGDSWLESRCNSSFSFCLSEMICRSAGVVAIRKQVQ